MTVPYRNPIVHDTGESIFPSSFELTDEALKNYKISRNKFGTTQILLPNGSSFVVKDYQYRLPNNDIGMHFIPVNDHGNVMTSDNKMVPGYFLIDDFLRNQMGLNEDEPIYVLINYFHPEQNKGSLKKLLLPPNEKVELGFTHLGAYYGKGYTTNAPMLYHSHRFGVSGEINQTSFGYPANVQVLSLEGVPQSELNKNLRYVDVCLNSGVMFPDKGPDAYKDSKFRPININTALMFYRDWILFKGYLREDESWYTYCAAHKTIVVTVAMNLPHNLDSFKEVYGAIEGAQLFEKFKLFYNTYIGPDPGFQTKDETCFKPLWKLQKLTADQIHPFSLEEYNAYEKARLSNSLKHFKGRQPMGHQDATSWACQSTSKVVSEVIEIYADMLDSGQIVMVSYILGFSEIFQARMGISSIQFLMHAMPIIDKIMVAHAKIHAAADPDNYLKNTFQELFLALEGDKNALPDFENELKKLEEYKTLDNSLLAFIKSKPLPEGLSAWALLGVIFNWDKIINGGAIDPIKAYEQFYLDVQNDLQNADDMLISGPEYVEFYTPPAIVHSICNGIYKTNPFVKIKEVCTIIDYSESQLKSNI